MILREPNEWLNKECFPFDKKLTDKKYTTKFQYCTYNMFLLDGIKEILSNIKKNF